MKIEVKGKNIEVTDAIEIKVVDKLSRLDKYFDNPQAITAKVLVRTYPYGQKIEVTIPTEYVLLRAEVVDEDLYKAIDTIVDILERQVRKYKTRINRKKRSVKESTAVVLNEIEKMIDEEKDEVVKTKSITPKPMDFEEAIMQMELIGHSFFVFKDTDTDSVNVVYKRKDGGYGLIETA